MLVIQKESHSDHVSKKILDFIVKRHKDLAIDAGVFIETFELPVKLGTVDCGLYGPAVGDPPVPESQVVYVTRLGRICPSRLIDKPMRQTRILTVIAGPYKGEPVVLYTVFGGPKAPWEVGDPLLPDDKKHESAAFWAEHALAKS